MFVYIDNLCCPCNIYADISEYMPLSLYYKRFHFKTCIEGPTTCWEPFEKNVYKIDNKFYNYRK